MKTNNTIRILVLLAGCAGGMTAAEVVVAAAAKTSEGVAGIWWIENYGPELSAPDNADLPFTPQGRSRYEQNLAQFKAGAMPDVGVTKCLPEGLPRTLFAPYPLQIVQHGNYVTLIHEVNHTFWSVALTGAHPGPEDLEPAFMGDSIGHWEHGALVTDSLGFKANSFLDDTGVPHGTKLHVTMRLRRLSHARLEVIATIDDPETFTRSFSVRHTYEWRPDVSLLEYVCGEDHRVLTGSRTKGVTLKWPAK